jgi:hypothetical protein
MRYFTFELRKRRKSLDRVCHSLLLRKNHVMLCLFIRNDQQYALIFTTPLFYVLAPTCFGSSLPSSGNYLDPSELPEIQIEWAVYHIMCGYVTCVPDCRGSVCCASQLGHDKPAHWPRNHTLYDIPPIRLVFQVTQKDLSSSLMVAGYCRNMQKPVHRIKEWYKSVPIVGHFFYVK